MHVTAECQVYIHIDILKQCTAIADSVITQHNPLGVPYMLSLQLSTTAHNLCSAVERYRCH